jgi:hypothetical protein
VLCCVVLLCCDARRLGDVCELKTRKLVGVRRKYCGHSTSVHVCVVVKVVNEIFSQSSRILRQWKIAIGFVMFVVTVVPSAVGRTDYLHVVFACGRGIEIRVAVRKCVEISKCVVQQRRSCELLPTIRS